MEMFHIMLKYTEYHTNVVFESIPTLSLELCSGIYKINTKKKSIRSDVKNDDKNYPNNAAYSYNVSHKICKDNFFLVGGAI